MGKLEQHIKEQLAKREITPSEKAWDKVVLELSEPSENKKNNRFWYYAIAASFIGMAVVSGLYYNTISKTTPVEVVNVERNQPEATSENTIEKNRDFETKPQVVAADMESNDHGKHSESDIAIPKIEEPKQEFQSEALLADGQQANPIVKEKPIYAEDKIIAQQLEVVLQKISGLEKDDVQITDAEVDSLLRIAQQEILTDKLFQQNGKVDAMALLTEVEDELDQSFRDQIFEKLKEGFFKVRTAVADRNN